MLYEYPSLFQDSRVPTRRADARAVDWVAEGSVLALAGGGALLAVLAEGAGTGARQPVPPRLALALARPRVAPGGAGGGGESRSEPKKTLSIKMDIEERR